MSSHHHRKALADHCLRRFFLVVLLFQVIIHNDDNSIVSSWSPTCRPIRSIRRCAFVRNPSSSAQTTTTTIHEGKAIANTGLVLASTNSATGFGSYQNTNHSFMKKEKKKKKEKQPPASSIYSQPALYDLAFGYRDFSSEVEFLLSQHYSIIGKSRNNTNTNNHNHHQASPLSILEVAAGPARHALEAVFGGYHPDQTNRETMIQSSSLSVTCIDNSSEMIEYAQQLAKEMKNRSDHSSDQNDNAVSLDDQFQYLQADMRNFTIAKSSSSSSFDTAWILLGSLQHLTTNADVMACFQCIHDALANHGTLFVELPHPREWLGMIDCTRNSWIVPIETRDDESKNENTNKLNDSKNTAAEAGQLEIVWGDEDDPFDPMTQIRQFTVQFAMKTTRNDNEPFHLRQVVPMRMFTAPEMDLLGRSTGFRLVRFFGSLEDGVDVNDEDAAFRMVCAFQKV